MPDQTLTAPQQATPDHAAEVARLKAVIDELERREIRSVAQQATPEPERITVQEAWEAAGGNPGIKASKADLLEALRQLDEVCDEATPEPDTCRKRPRCGRADPCAWDGDVRDRLTVNLLRQGVGLTKTQIRALISHAVDGTETDPALFPATPEPPRSIIGFGAHALAGELAAALNTDLRIENAYGLLGKHTMAWLRKVSAEYLSQAATPEPVGEHVATVFTMEALDPWTFDGSGPRCHVNLHVDLPAGTKLYTRPAAAPDTVPRDAYDALERERDYWRTRARAMIDHAEGTCWYWVGDGEDHLESLVNNLPVVIRADQLRDLLAAAPAVPGLQWFTVAEHGMPEIGEEVIGGLWYTDPWLVPEKATRFMWGLCRVLKDEHRDYPDGKRWQTFGPSHNQITHWARLNVPALAAAQANGEQA